MKKKNVMKAGILLTIPMLLMLVLPVSAEPAAPIVKIEIPNQSGIGIKATLKSIGTDDATNVDWTISATGGCIIFPPTTKSGTIASIAPGTSMTIKAIFFGFGKISTSFDSVTFTVTATYATPVSTPTPTGPTHLFFILIW